MRLITSLGNEVPLIADDWKPDIDEIAWSLAQIRCYGGHALPYSYAQHSVLVSHLAPTNNAFSALMHDAHVVYCGALTDQQREAADHATGGRWTAYEARFARKVRQAFALPPSLPRAVGEANQLAVEYEIGWLFNKVGREAWANMGFKPRRTQILGWDGGSLKSWSTQDAYERFLKRFISLGGG